MDVRGRRSRDLSPERMKICTQPRVIRPAFKKVQVVYYLTRNGHLEHPHYLEVAHLANQQLRLKDVIDRLTLLRGKGMPSLYSWSCKRSYKNGYVWNDLAENDIIYPSEGGEYVLKGSELIIDGCTEKLQHLQVGNSNITTQQFQQLPLGNKGVAETTNFHSKRRSSPHHHLISYEEEDPQPLDQEDQEYEEKISCYTTTPQHSRCSRGVSTDEHHHQLRRQPPQEQEQEHQKQKEGLSQENMKNLPSELNLEENESPPSTTSSSLSDKAMNEANNTSKRFEDGDPVGTEPLLSRNSMLFQLMACGGSLSFRGTNNNNNGKNVPVSKQQQLPPPQATTAVAARRSSCSDLHKGVLCKSVEAGNKAVVVAAVEEEEEIKYMSENPRFGNLQAEEKEYFSGSIVESMATDERAQIQPSSLKKSSSYNEERGPKLALEETEVTEEVKREKALRLKCIPRKKSSSKQSKK